MKQYRQYQPSSKNEHKNKKKQNWFNKKWIPAKYLILIDLILSEIGIFIISISWVSDGHTSMIPALVATHIAYYGGLFVCFLIDKLECKIEDFIYKKRP